jgi:glycine cleavage system H protein
MKEDLPQNLLYNKDYSWIKIEGELATLGIIKSAAENVKEFVFVKLPEKNEELKAGETYVSLEAMKWSGHLSSPISGEVIEVNEEVFDDPAIINESPYDKGWFCKVKLSKPEEKELLLSADDLDKYLQKNKIK